MSAVAMTPWDWFQLLATLPLVAFAGLLGFVIEIGELFFPEEALAAP